MLTRSLQPSLANAIVQDAITQMQQSIDESTDPTMEFLVMSKIDFMITLGHFRTKIKAILKPQLLDNLHNRTVFKHKRKNAVRQLNLFFILFIHILF
jgi:hypothetical protein